MDAVTFEGVRIGGRLVTPAEDSRLEVDAETTADVRFLATAPGVN